VPLGRAEGRRDLVAFVIDANIHSRLEESQRAMVTGPLATARRRALGVVHRSMFEWVHGLQFSPDHVPIFAAEANGVDDKQSGDDQRNVEQQAHPELPLRGFCASRCTAVFYRLRKPLLTVKIDVRGRCRGAPPLGRPSAGFRSASQMAKK
jgi:hypothetical protein